MNNLLLQIIKVKSLIKLFFSKIIEGGLFLASYYFNYKHGCLICLGLVHEIIVELNLVLNRKFNISFCRWTRLRTTQKAVRSSSESLANTSVSEKVSYEIN